MKEVPEVYRCTVQEPRTPSRLCLPPRRFADALAQHHDSEHLARFEELMEVRMRSGSREEGRALHSRCLLVGM